ncbi:MAG: SRPBCC family protein [Actinomycetota bacterium]
MASSDALPAGREIPFEMSFRTAAPPEAVFDQLADVGSHLEWGGSKGNKKFHLTGLQIGTGPAVKGTEWTSTGMAPDGTFTDRSVVHEATRPTRFEFTTEAHAAFRKGGEGDWTVVNRYDIAPDGAGSRVTYRQTVTRATAMGPMKMMLTPVLGSVGRMMVKALNKKAMRNLAAMAEERAKR